MVENINWMQLEIIKQAYNLLLSFLVCWIFFKIVEYLTNKISIIDYVYSGKDMLGNKVKIIWYFSENSKNIKGNKYPNNKYYFKVYTKFVKSNEKDEDSVLNVSPLEIDIDDINTYDFSTIVIINKNEMCFKTRIKLIRWLFLNFYRKKPEPKNLPSFLVEPHIFTDALYLNIENLYKNFKKE